MKIKELIETIKQSESGNLSKSFIQNLKKQPTISFAEILKQVLKDKPNLQNIVVDSLNNLIK